MRLEIKFNSNGRLDQLCLDVYLTLRAFDDPRKTGHEVLSLGVDDLDLQFSTRCQSDDPSKVIFMRASQL